MLPNESTTRSPDEKPRRSLSEVEEWNRLLDYEEECMAKGAEEGLRLLKEKQASQKRQPMLSTEPSPSMNTPETITTSQPKPRPGLSNEAKEWMRMQDYRDDCMLKGVEEGVKAWKEDQTKKQRQPMLATELSPWARKLKDHLKEFRPKEYAELIAAGNLHETVQDRADQAKLEMSDLLQSGLPYNQAFEMIKDQLYPPPESMWRKP